ncbi:MAG: PAS domain S-box protein, partial [Gammaproteobacteria bacterium]
MDAVVVTDDDGLIILFNKFAEKLFGYQQQDIVGKPLDILVPIEARERHKLHISEFVKSQESGRHMAERRTVHGLHANGHHILVEASIYQTSVRGNNYYTAILRDISPIRETEALLRKKTHELEQYLRHYKNELNATQTRLSEVQRLSQTGIWDLDIAQNKLYWSDEVFDIFEIDKSRFGASYEAFLAAVHPDDRANVDRLFQQSVKHRTPYQVRHRLVMNDGRIKHVDERGETYYNESGDPIRSVGTIQDITSRITTDQQRRNLQHLLLRAETMAEIGSWEWNLTTGKLYWSPELYRQYGIDQTNVPEPDFELAINVVHPDDRNKVRSIFNNALTAEHSDDHAIEYRIRRPSGEIRYVRSQGQVIKNESGIPIFLYGIIKDITEYVHAESQIRKSNQLLEAVFDTVHVRIAYLDRNMNFIRVNRPYAEIERKEPEYFIGKNHFDLYPNEENEAIFKNAVFTGEQVVFDAKPFEYTNKPERGVTHWDWTLTPVKNDNGYVTGLVLTLLEVSERINAIEALQINEEKLQSLNENLEQIVEQRTEELQDERNFIDTVLQIQGALVIVLDRNGCIVRFNRACEETSGYSFDEVSGKPVWNFVIPP